jgi:hypothetical protein
VSLARTRGKTIGAFVGAWGAVCFGPWLVNQLCTRLEDYFRDHLSGAPLEVALHLMRAVTQTTNHTIFYAVWLGTIGWSLGFIVRMLARSGVRTSQHDVLDSARAWVRAHPNALTLLAGGVGLGWAASVFRDFIGYRWNIPMPLFGLSLLDGLAMAWWARFSARALLAPTTDDAEDARFEITDDEIGFDAVAVTAETKGAVLALFALTCATMALLASPLLPEPSNVPVYVGLGYAAMAAASATLFTLASRVAVGVDGVHVGGTSRAKFFAYRDFDEARVRWSTIQLLRKGRVVLRLQLHGQDVARRDAILARILENLERVREGRGAVAAQMVASSSKEALARVAHGGADYRMAALTREQLWALVEGPEIEASARKAAAAALATASDESERVRLRVAASLCAEPQVRVALEELARGESDAGDSPMRRAAT